MKETDEKGPTRWPSGCGFIATESIRGIVTTFLGYDKYTNDGREYACECPKNGKSL